MSGSEDANDGSGNSSNNKSSSSEDCEGIASALATPTSSDGAATSTTPPADHQQELGGPADEMATLRANNGRSVIVTIVSPAVGKNAKRSWVWQVFHRISPSINNKTVFCRKCKHLLLWKPAGGTNGMSKHYQTKHPREYEELMKDHTTVADGRSNVMKAVGGLMAFR